MDDNINVSLTTTKHLLATSKGSPEDLQKLNTPVCVAVMRIPVSKREIPKMTQLCLDMAREVFIDLEKKYVFIGEDHKDPESALVEYTEDDPGEYAEDFFSQWKKTRILMFEFISLNMHDKPFFSLRGMWDRDRWHILQIHKGAPALNILKKSRVGWGTFSTHSLTKGVG